MGNEIAKVTFDDGWEDAAAENATRKIKGKHLKYDDRRWKTGKDNNDLTGTKLVVLATAKEWAKFSGSKVVDQRPYTSGNPILREELGDDDDTQWEPGPDGKPQDPWSDVRYVYLEDPNTAESYTFTTSSAGGRSAVLDLADQIQRMRLRHPGAIPLIELQSAPMPTRFGMKSKPFFKVIGWDARTTASVTRFPPAPGRFSTMNC
jgi:hypothetical protein